VTTRPQLVNVPTGDVVNASITTVVDVLARAARQHGVMISLTVTPYTSAVDTDPSTDDLGGYAHA
jgi:hypothetical protein